MSKRGQENLALAVCSVALLIVVAAFVAVSVAHSQEPERAQLVLEQVAVAECGWKAEDCHAAVWWTLRRRAALSRGRRSAAQVAVDYCAVFDARNDDDERSRWVRGLPAVEVDDGVDSGTGAAGDIGDGGGGHHDDVAGGRSPERARNGDRGGVADDAARVDVSTRSPRGWPAGVSWRRYLPLWRAVYARAGAFLARQVADPCGAPTIHFGASYGVDKRRAERARWRLVSCGNTGRQRFYAWGSS